MTVVAGPALDRYGHLYPEPDSALRDRLNALYGTARPTQLNLRPVPCQGAGELHGDLRWVGEYAR